MCGKEFTFPYEKVQCSECKRIRKYYYEYNQSTLQFSKNLKELSKEGIKRYCPSCMTVIN